MNRDEGVLWSGPHVRLRQCRYGVMLLNVHDQGIGIGLDMYGEWAEAEIAIMRSYISEGDTVLDVGANVGTHALALGTLVGPTGAVHSFEPQPAVFALLAANIVLNGALQCRPYQAGLSESQGEAWIPDYRYNEPGNYGAVPLNAINPVNHSSAGEARISVPLTTIDALNLSRCDLIKIDAEGMEHAVLSGATNTIAQFRPIIYAENNDRNRSIPVLKKLLDSEYIVYFHSPLAYNPSNYYGNVENLFGGAAEDNVIAIPAEKHVDQLPLQRALSDLDYPYPA